jgi:hypothetical protein
VQAYFNPHVSFQQGLVRTGGLTNYLDYYGIMFPYRLFFFATHSMVNLFIGTPIVTFCMAIYSANLYAWPSPPTCNWGEGLRHRIVR